MTRIIPEMAGIALYVVAGWVALWPARRTLGPVAYHLAALPIGVLASTLAASIAGLSGRPLDVLSSILGGVALAVIGQLLFRLLGSPPASPRRVSGASFAVAGVSLTALSALFGVLRLTVINNDSVASYWPLAMELANKGQMTRLLMGTRSILIPAMSATFHALGSDWAYVIYPMFAVTLLGWLVTTLLEGPLAPVRRGLAWSIAGVAALALVIEPSFLFHTFFVHSHMMSAVYLLMSLTCVWFSARPGAEDAPIDRTFLVLAGLLAAAFALTRPDGLAYHFVPIAAAVAVLTRGRVELRSVAAFFAPMATSFVIAFGTAYIELGIWGSSKLSGKKTAVMLAAFFFAVIGPWIVQWLDRKLPFRVSGESFLSVFVAGAAAVMALALAVRWHASAREALTNAWVNLLAGAGGYNYLWWGVIAVMVLSVLTRLAVRRGSWARAPFLSVLLFFIIALVVHGVSHEGRVGSGDSLNRVAFHALPLIVWYVATVVAQISNAKRAAPTAETVAEP